MLRATVKESLDRAEQQLLAWDSDGRALLPEPRPDDIMTAIETYRHAQTMVPWDPRPEAFSTVVALADIYLSADASLRKEIREVVARAPRVAQELFPLMGRCADRLRASSEVEWLRRALAIAGISDGYPDWRDLYGELGYLYGAALAAGVPPSTHFREVGRIASDEVRHWGSTREQIEEFELSAAFDEMRRADWQM